MNIPKLLIAEEKVGGKFRLAALLQKRVVELAMGSEKLVDVDTDSPIDIALEEIIQGKINLSNQKKNES